MILDIHTHHAAPQPLAVVNLAAPGQAMLPGQLYSAGIHPWDTEREIRPEDLDALLAAARRPQVVAIGEAGIDAVKGGPMFRQINIFRRQAILAETLRKPLIVHDVKAHETVLGIFSELRPSVPWIIHGFRYKPSVARMFTDKGIYLSFGERFTPATLAAVPRPLLLAETDESQLTITEIIAALSAEAGTDLTPVIAENCRRVLEKGLTDSLI